MSVADPSLTASNPAGRIPLAVSLAPQFVNRLCGRLQRGGVEMAGLLFGVGGEGLVLVQAFKSFGGDSNDAIPATGEALKQAFEQLLQSAHADPEISVLDLIGWYWTRAAGGLSAADVEFHNTHFPRPNSLALILKPENKNNIVLELYTRANSPKLLPQDHLWGALRLSTDMSIAGPIEVAMRPTGGDELYLRTYQTMEALDRAVRKNEWRQKVQATARLPLSILRRRESASTETAHASAPAATTPPPSDARIVRPAPAPATVDRKPKQDSLISLRINAGEPPGLPALRPQPQRPVPWLGSAILCVVMAGVTFLFLLLRGFAVGGALPPFLSAIFPDTGLQLRAEGQGDRVLLSWNRRNFVVRSASDGVLHISDGTQRREVHLDPAQVENGLVLYRPGSNDVTFRLEIHGQQGGRLSESVRVLDGTGDGSPHLTETPEPTTPPAAAAAVETAAPKPVQPHREWKVAAITETDGSSARAQSAGGSGESPAATRPSARSAESSGAPPVLVSSVPAPPLSAGPASTLSSTPNATPPGASSLNANTTSESSPAATPESKGLSTSGSAPTDSSPPRASNTTADTSPAKSTDTARNPSSIAAPNSAVPLPLGTPQTNASNDVLSPPRAVHQVLPETSTISPEALASHPDVEVLVLVDPNGHVTAAHVVNHGKRINETLSTAVIAAAKQWAFEPATFQGHTVPSHHTIVFQFRAPDR